MNNLITADSAQEFYIKKKFYIEQWEYNFRSSFCCQLVTYHKKHCRLVDICHLSFLRELIKHLLDLIMHSLVLCAQKHIWEFTCHFEKTQTLPYVDGVYTYIKHSAVHLLSKNHMRILYIAHLRTPFSCTLRCLAASGDTEYFL